MAKEPPSKQNTATVATDSQIARANSGGAGGNIFNRAASAQNAFNRQMAENGYKAFTTFYSDLTMAEPWGEKGIRDTHRNVERSWGKDAKYWTEYTMSLNHKIWEHYRTNERLARVYDDLWRKADDHARKTFKGKDLDYYYRTTD